MEQHWKSAKGLFGAVLGPPLFWLVLFFLIPMGIVWLYSFGENQGLTEIALTGTFSNYLRALDPLYLMIFAKSVGIAALTTLICLIIGFPVALAITFAPPKAKTWLLLAVMLPFWTNLLIRTYALIAFLRTEGYINQSLEWVWNGLGSAVSVLGIGVLGPFEPLDLLHNN
ncbi:MAG: ABC transporter permease, partial [Phenylobacterium sp.]